jgi:hypothetical protein
MICMHVSTFYMIHVYVLVSLLFLLELRRKFHSYVL